MKGKLQDYALLAEIVSAIAVVTSLIFVGIQVNQSNIETAFQTEVIQNSAYQDLVGQITEINLLIMGNEEFADLLERASDGEEIDRVGRRQLYVLLTTTFRHGELAYRQYDSQLIDEKSLVSLLNPLISLLNSPEARQSWKVFSSNLNQDFVNFVNKEANLCELFPDDDLNC